MAGSYVRGERLVLFLGNACILNPYLHPPPAPIAWGRHHESTAIRKYISHMNTTGNSTITVEKCGFIIHLVEIKCPYTKPEMTPEEACSDRNFCCEVVESKIWLKQTHSYYQVQLQLYVGSDISLVRFLYFYL